MNKFVCNFRDCHFSTIKLNFFVLHVLINLIGFFNKFKKIIFNKIFLIRLISKISTSPRIGPEYFNKKFQFMINYKLCINSNGILKKEWPGISFWLQRCRISILFWIKLQQLIKIIAVLFNVSSFQKKFFSRLVQLFSLLF